jgi:hypothetical protein
VRGRRAYRVEDTGAAAEFGVPGYTDLAAMLDRERPDLVALTLPNENHFEPTLQVIRAGVPVFAEKPLVFELDEADQLLREAPSGLCSSPSTSTTGTPSRCSSRTTRTQRALGARSSPPGASAARRAPAPIRTRTSSRRSATASTCSSTSAADDSVAAQMTDLSGRGFSTLVVALHFANGAVGSLVGSYDSSYAYPATHHLEVNGTDAVSWSPTPSAASR